MYEYEPACRAVQLSGKTRFVIASAPAIMTTPYIAIIESSGPHPSDRKAKVLDPEISYPSLIEEILLMAPGFAADCEVVVKIFPAEDFARYFDPEMKQILDEEVYPDYQSTCLTYTGVDEDMRHMVKEHDIGGFEIKSYQLGGKLYLYPEDIPEAKRSSAKEVWVYAPYRKGDPMFDTVDEIR